MINTFGHAPGSRGGCGSGGVRELGLVIRRGPLFCLDSDRGAAAAAVTAARPIVSSSTCTPAR